MADAQRSRSEKEKFDLDSTYFMQPSRWPTRRSSAA